MISADAAVKDFGYLVVWFMSLDLTNYNNKTTTCVVTDYTKTNVLYEGSCSLAPHNNHIVIVGTFMVPSPMMMHYKVLAK